MGPRTRVPQVPLRHPSGGLWQEWREGRLEDRGPAPASPYARSGGLTVGVGCVGGRGDVLQLHLLHVGARPTPVGIPLPGGGLLPFGDSRPLAAPLLLGATPGQVVGEAGLLGLLLVGGVGGGVGLLLDSGVGGGVGLPLVTGPGPGNCQCQEAPGPRANCPPRDELSPGGGVQCCNSECQVWSTAHWEKHTAK